MTADHGLVADDQRWALRAAHALGRPTLAKTHNLVNLKYYQHIDCLVPTTRAQERYLLERGIARESIERIPNFSRVPAIDSVPHASGPPFRIVALGRFVTKKGFDTLLEAFALLRAEGLAATLEIGGDGAERTRLERDIARHGLEAAVTLRGWIDDARAFLDGAALFVLPNPSGRNAHYSYAEMLKHWQELAEWLKRN